jgi:hypothetical protein
MGPSVALETSPQPGVGSERLAATWHRTLGLPVQGPRPIFTRVISGAHA